MRGGKSWGWPTFILSLAFFVIPLLGMLEFSLRMRRGVYSFDA